LGSGCIGVVHAGGIMRYMAPCPPVCCLWVGDWAVYVYDAQRRMCYVCREQGGGRFLDAKTR
jgi:hypothetical protein